MSVYKSKKWSKLTKLLFRSFENKCMCCGISQSLVVCPVKNTEVYKKSTYDIRNLQILCDRCKQKNRYKSIDFRTKKQLSFLQLRYTNEFSK